MSTGAATTGAAAGVAATGVAATGSGLRAFNFCSKSAEKPSTVFSSAIILSTFVISSSPAFLDLKNTFLAAALNLISSIISTHLIVKLSVPETGTPVTGAAAGVATAGVTETGSGIVSLSKPNNLSPFIIFSSFSLIFFR